MRLIPKCDCSICDKGLFFWIAFDLVSLKFHFGLLGMVYVMNEVIKYCMFIIGIIYYFASINSSASNVNPVIQWEHIKIFGDMNDEK